MTENGMISVIIGDLSVIFDIMDAYNVRMMERIKTLVSLIIIIICLPYLVTFVVQGDFINDSEQENVSDNVNEDTERLILTIANEMPVIYEEEALKAQAVIARTNLAYAKEHDQAEPEYVSREELRKRFGNKDFQKYYERLKNCVEETVGEIITYKEKIVQLPYHFVSAGKTRKLEDDDGKKNAAYLKSVSSMSDLGSEYFLKVEFYTKKQFCNKLKSAFPDIQFPENAADQAASVVKRDQASYVLTVQLPGQKISGEQFKDAFSLNSTCFSIKETDGQIRIVTKGYGQGYGMSQYGANEMAKEGGSYEEILNYYYSGIEITNDKQ